ncbi:sensor histidine kinase [Thermoanaerobacterium thermosaccharolyticum]|uniref:Histidine kinase n=2 Tax=Thermoanaerobacterium thermosaccharolyticum TaxID=1517 RepID=L0IPA0_THETR|nr:GHKL domain-containing protein [Thermoanaerobacterium thermosaccharolyticum]AGB19797.1 histidine kinase [Thermoanaerobacterium thermosaccharolyticum M0795]KAA5805729.1 GHKL domain-containing protein [Thermoanaerobacterium thermosaccharolyticum]OXT08787.1 histidine kinase [Thermoanaerobacterium thermosaccharolyticum]TCW42162.1 two-component system sensor histidine kinase AgrC [Thermohydrogenium kirishiense]
MIRKSLNKIIAIFFIYMIFITFMFDNSMYYQQKIIIPADFELFLFFTIVVINVLVFTIIRMIYINGKNEYQYIINDFKLRFIEEQNNLYRKNKHELRNKILVLYELIRQMKYEDAEEFLMTYIDDINNSLIKVDTGNDIIDLLLYSKISAAIEKNISVNFICTVDLKYSKKVTNDICSVLGNLLDNAIEECDRLKNNKRIEIMLKSDPVDYIFIVKNTCGEISEDVKRNILSGGFTTKGDGRGTGLSIVKDIVYSYNGDINIKIDDKYFDVTVEIPSYKLNEK